MDAEQDVVPGWPKGRVEAEHRAAIIGRPEVVAFAGKLPEADARRCGGEGHPFLCFARHPFGMPRLVDRGAEQDQRSSEPDEESLEREDARFRIAGDEGAWSF